MAKKKNKYDVILEDLTPRQQLFAQKYIEFNFDRDRAAIAAGYSENGAPQQAQRLLKNVQIQNYIKSIKDDLGVRLGITRERLVMEVAKSAFADVTDLLTVDGGMKPLNDIPKETTGAVASIEIYEEFAGDEVIGQTKKIKMNDKTRAQDLLSQLLGYKAPIKTEVAVSGGVVELPKKDLHKDE